MATTVTAGNTASFTLGPFQTLNLSTGRGGGSIVMTSAAPKLVADQSLAIQNGTFGPYGCPMTVVMTVRQGSVDYTVSEASRLVSVDSSGYVLTGAGSVLPGSRLATSAVASAITDSPGQSTTESTLATLVIPALTLGVDDGLEIETIWSCTNTAATKRIRGRFGGTVLWNLDLTTHLVYRHTFKLRNRNSRASQVSQANSTTIFGPIGSVGAQTFTLDFAAEQTLTITGQFPVAGTSLNTLTLEEYTVRVV